MYQIFYYLCIEIIIGIIIISIIIMVTIKNPFVVGSYISPEYFCGRKHETQLLVKHVENGRNVAMIAPRRLGKTGLIWHFLQLPEIKSQYYTLFVDLYSTSSLPEMVRSLAMEVYRNLQSNTERWWERFASVISSLNMNIAADPITGAPSLSIGLGQIKSPEVTLDQIFKYLETADRPCIVAIDEFQQIANYKEKNVEALLRTRIQQCSNTHFIYSGSKRHMMVQMFNSPSRPFYQSCINMSLDTLPVEEYISFAQRMFETQDKKIKREVVDKVYSDFEGVTWYMQMMMNELFAMTGKGETCNMDYYQVALENVVFSQKQIYDDIFAVMPHKQKMLLEAIASEGKVLQVTSGAFVRKHSLLSASSVQSSLKGLLEKDIVTQTDGGYQLYDYFMAYYLNKRC